MSDGYDTGTIAANVTVGLSKMQHAVLELLDDTADERDGDPLKTAEILIALYGFPPPSHTSRVGRIFDPDVIGRKRYASARASLSRTLRRLEQRNLIVVMEGAYMKWTGVKRVDEPEFKSKLPVRT